MNLKNSGEENMGEFRRRQERRKYCKLYYNLKMFLKEKNMFLDGMAFFNVKWKQCQCQHESLF